MNYRVSSSTALGEVRLQSEVFFVERILLVCNWVIMGGEGPHLYVWMDRVNENPAP